MTAIENTPANAAPNREEADNDIGVIEDASNVLNELQSSQEGNKEEQVVVDRVEHVQAVPVSKGRGVSESRGVSKQIENETKVSEPLLKQVEEQVISVSASESYAMSNSAEKPVEEMINSVEVKETSACAESLKAQKPVTDRQVSEDYLAGLTMTSSGQSWSDTLDLSENNNIEKVEEQVVLESASNKSKQSRDPVDSGKHEKPSTKQSSSANKKSQGSESPSKKEDKTTPKQSKSSPSSSSPHKSKQAESKKLPKGKSKGDVRPKEQSSPEKRSKKSEESASSIEGAAVNGYDDSLPNGLSENTDNQSEVKLVFLIEPAVIRMDDAMATTVNKL